MLISRLKNTWSRLLLEPGRIREFLLVLPQGVLRPVETNGPAAMRGRDFVTPDDVKSIAELAVALGIILKRNIR